MLPRTIVLLLVALVALVSAAYVRGGLPYAMHRASGRTVALGSDARGVFWLEGDANADAPGQSAWVLERGRRPARCVLTQAGLTAVAGAGDSLVVLRREGFSGKLLRVPRGGGAAVTLAEGLSHPVGLAAGDGEAYWTETQPRLVPGARHLPATQARVSLRAARLDGSGEPRTVAWLRGGTQEFEGEILEAAQGRVYLVEVTGRDCGAGWSRTLSVPAAGGVVETAALERGTQTALLHGDRLCWTAASLDAGDPAMARSLNVGGRLPAPDTGPLTDWLPSAGRLCEAGGRTYYASADGLWRLPEQRDLPRLVVARPLAGESVAGYGGAVYTVGGGGVLLRWPCTPAARLLAGIRIR